MRNKIYYILLSLIASFSFINSVFAEGNLDFSISANVVGGETTVVAGNESTINVAINSNTYISTCTFEITSDSGIDSVSKLGMNNYSVDAGESKVIIDRSVTDTAFTSGQAVLQLKYKINNAGKVTIKTLDCTAPEGNKTGSYQDVSVEFQTKDISEDTTLSQLSVTGGTLSPNFSPSRNSYTIKLDSPNFSLDMIASNPDYQDDIVVTNDNGDRLDYRNLTFNDPSGQAKMKINVLVNNKTAYSLLAVYEKVEFDNSLASLRVDGKEIGLEVGKYDYTVSIKGDAASVRIEAILRDSANFQFSENNGPTTFQTPSASNTYPLIIEPKDSSSGAKGVIYTITLVKEGGAPSSSSSSSSPSSNNQGNTTTNPSTGGISMFIIAIILFASLVGSIILYQKNLEGYSK